MLAIVRTAALFGVDAHPVRVEVDVSDGGLPSTTLVGLPDASVRESRDRIESAIRNSGFEFPKRRVTVNLSPADMRKVGSAFDLGAWVTRDAAAAGDERPINVKWFKHQGPGDVVFSERTASVERDAWAQEGGAQVAATATFSEPGDYLLRLLVFNVVRDFEFQCCWTNGYVPVAVAP